MGSFESWAATMGGILRVAGIKGFLQNRQEVYSQAESEHQAWHEFISIWWEKYHDARVSVHLLFNLAREHGLLTELRANRTDQGARVAMGKALASRRDRIFRGYRVLSAGYAPDGRALIISFEGFLMNVTQRLGNPRKLGRPSQEMYRGYRVFRVSTLGNLFRGG